MGRWLRDYPLAIALFVLYAAIQIGAAVTGWFEFAAEQAQHQRPAELFGPDGYVWMLLEQTLQNWQSEFLALATLVVLSAVLIHRNSKHSKDGDEERQRRVEEIRRRVARLAGSAEEA
jgi:membrane protein implicated in regulation of membrane protease activity